MKVLLKITSTLFIMALLFTNGIAQNHTKVEQDFLTAYLTNSIPAWKVTLTNLEKNKQVYPALLLAKGYYAAASTGMGNQDEDFTSEMLDKAAVLTKSIIGKDKKSPEANALLSSIYGMKIGLSPMKGMFLGSKSSSQAEKGVKLAPENAFTNYVMGSYLYYTPSMFGGDAKESLTYLEKSKNLYEAQSNTQSWEYLNLLSLLGQAYHQQEQYDEAMATYKKALEVAPNFGYIKMVLLPRTEKVAKKVKGA